MTSTPPTTRQRGGCLTVFLALMLIGNLVVALSYLFAGAMVRQSVPALPEWGVPALGALGLANGVFAVAIWRWRKWGVYGFAASAVATFIVNMIGTGFLYASVGLIGVGLLAVLLQPIWREME